VGSEKISTNTIKLLLLSFFAEPAGDSGIQFGWVPSFWTLLDQAFYKPDALYLPPDQHCHSTDGVCGNGPQVLGVDLTFRQKAEMCIVCS